MIILVCIHGNQASYSHQILKQDTYYYHSICNNNINHYDSTSINILSKEATSTEGDEKKYKGGEHTIGRISEL